MRVPDLERLNEVVLRAHAAGRWAFLNRAWQRITGFTLEASMGRCFLDCVDPRDRAAVQAGFAPDGGDAPEHPPRGALPGPRRRRALARCPRATRQRAAAIDRDLGRSPVADVGGQSGALERQAALFGAALKQALDT
jgi:PAS domain-containing protein